MAEIEYEHAHGTSNATHTKKRKGFWSNIFGRSSNATHPHEKQDEKEPKRKGFMNTLMTNASEAAAKEVAHLAEEEAMKQVEEELNGNNNNSDNGSQPTNTTTTTTTTTTANVAPDTSTPSDVLSTPTNWAKRMVDGVQQKVNDLQNLASS